VTDNPNSTIEEHLASIAASMTTLVEENRDLRERLDAALVRIDAQNDLIRRRTNAYRVTVLAFVGVLIAFGVIILDNQQAIAENNRKLCPVVGAMVSGPPPSTARGIWARDIFARLFIEYGCTPEDIEDIPESTS
jgi:hypothetical protein